MTRDLAGLPKCELHVHLEGSLRPDTMRALAARQLDPLLPVMKAHGVPWLIRHLNGEITLGDATEGAIMDTRRYAKRQLTFFRSVPGVCWLSPEDVEGVRERLQAFARDSEPG